MAEFTPTTEIVRARYCLATVNEVGFPGWEEYKARHDAEFDRWLAEHPQTYTVEVTAHFEDYPEGSLFIDDSDGTVYRLTGWTLKGGHYEPAELDQPILERVDINAGDDEGWAFPLRHVWSPGA